MANPPPAGVLTPVVPTLISGQLTSGYPPISQGTLASAQSAPAPTQGAQSGGQGATGTQGVSAPAQNLTAQDLIPGAPAAPNIPSAASPTDQPLTPKGSPRIGLGPSAGD